MSKPLRNTPSAALVVLSDNLSALAQQNEWTQQQLGNAIGIGQRQAARIMARESEITLASLSVISEKLRIPVPLLLCPGMDGSRLQANPGMREEILSLIEQLIALEKEGKLTKQALTFISHSLSLTRGPQSSRTKTGKSAAQ